MLCLDKYYIAPDNLLKCKKGDPRFKIRLDSFLEECGLTEKYRGLFYD